MKKTIKLLSFGLIMAFSLSTTLSSCGDDKKEDKDDKESTESPTKKGELDLCACVDASKEAYLNGGEIPKELDSKCEELFKNTPNAENELMNCANYQELMELGEKMANEQKEAYPVPEVVTTSDLSCDEIIEEYDSFMEEFKEISEKIKGDPQNAEAIAAYSKLAPKAMEFSTSFANSDCMTDEEFNNKIDAINEKHAVN